MAHQNVMLLATQDVSEFGHRVIDFFTADLIDDFALLTHEVNLCDYRALVVDDINGSFDLDLYTHLFAIEDVNDLSVILLVNEATLGQKIKAYELGVDDVITTNAGVDDVSARITKAIFHNIANTQLQMIRCFDDVVSFSASSTMQYHSTIDFLLQIHDCDNLDQLGQLFFTLMATYKLSCSLQMRSIMGDKNMEAHGMSKELESELLTALAEQSEDFDFGKKTIICYRDISILIKDMPRDDDETCLAIKSMVRVLAQGLHARVSALNNQCGLLKEKDLVCEVAQEIRYAVKMISHAHTHVIKHIFTQLECMILTLSEITHVVKISEESRIALESIVKQCREQIDVIKQDDSVVENSCQRLESTIEKMLVLLGISNYAHVSCSTALV